MAVKVTKVYEIDISDKSLNGLLKALRALRDAGVPGNALLVNAPEKLVLHSDQIETATEIVNVFVRPQ